MAFKTLHLVCSFFFDAFLSLLVRSFLADYLTPSYFKDHTFFLLRSLCLPEKPPSLTGFPFLKSLSPFKSAVSFFPQALTFFLPGNLQVSIAPPGPSFSPVSPSRSRFQRDRLTSQYFLHSLPKPRSPPFFIDYGIPFLNKGHSFSPPQLAYAPRARLDMALRDILCLKTFWNPASWREPSDSPPSAIPLKSVTFCVPRFFSLSQHRNCLCSSGFSPMSFPPSFFIGLSISPFTISMFPPELLSGDFFNFFPLFYSKGVSSLLWSECFPLLFAKVSSPWTRSASFS